MLIWTVLRFLWSIKQILLNATTLEFSEESQNHQFRKKQVFLLFVSLFVTSYSRACLTKATFFQIFYFFHFHFFSFIKFFFYFVQPTSSETIFLSYSFNNILIVIILQNHFFNFFSSFFQRLNLKIYSNGLIREQKLVNPKIWFSFFLTNKKFLWKWNH